VDTAELSGREITSGLDTEDYLPAMAGTWFIGGGDSTKLRLAFSQTLNRPDFKELSRAPYFDPVTKRIVRGNPDLIQADITNYDIRFEHFFSQNENISLSLFYKDFDKPIEKVQIESVQEERSFINSDEAKLYGFEIEGLKNLRFIHEALYNFYLSANFAYIESEATFRPDPASDLEIDLTNRSHPLQGQPDYTYNLTLGYENQSTGSVATLLLNGQGEQIDALGTDDLDDQYKQPFFTIDFTYSQDLKDNWTITFEAENLTDTEFEFKQNDITTRSYTKGRTFMLGLKYAF
jgi:TonB-dependent receptor